MSVLIVGLSIGCVLLPLPMAGVNRSRANRLLTGTWDNGAGNGICSNPASGSVKGDEGDKGEVGNGPGVVGCG